MEAKTTLTASNSAPQPGPDTAPGALCAQGRIGIHTPGFSNRSADVNVKPALPGAIQEPPAGLRWSDWLPPPDPPPPDGPESALARPELCNLLLSLWHELARLHELSTAHGPQTVSQNLHATNLAAPCRELYRTAMALLDFLKLNDFRRRGDDTISNVRSPSRALSCKQAEQQLTNAITIMSSAAATPETREAARLEAAQISANLMRLLDETLYFCAAITKDVLAAQRRRAAIPADLEAERIEMLLEHIGMVLTICGFRLAALLEPYQEDRADVALS